ncbi:MAG: hypothetical protein GEU91_22480 [Rhizobiales bacterium]|nr:hypothetical protein [Hyphomicrobiales bacterium]
MLKRALILPEASISQFDGSSGVVWTVEQGMLHRRPVTLGKRALDGRIEVVGGIPDGAQVPATISADFREQRAVRVAQDQAR